MVFTPISSSDFHPACRKGKRPRNPFNDHRLGLQWSNLSAAQYTSQEVVVNRISNTKSEATGYYRLLNNDRVELPELIHHTCHISNEGFGLAPY